jgi:hypothetical protein
MNELDWLRDFRADVPVPHPAALAAGRRRLLAAITQPPAHRVRRPSESGFVRRGWSALVAAGALATAVSVGIAVSGGRPQRIEVPSAQMRLAATVLHRAAIERAAHAMPRPSAHQWLYTTFVEQELGQPAQRSSGWLRFDGRQDAYLDNGRVVLHDHPAPAGLPTDPLRAYIENPTPMSSSAALASLPADPRALLREVLTAARSGYDPNGLPTLARVPVDTPARLEFQFLAQLLWQDTQSGVVSGDANVFRALSLLPGVTAQSGPTDALGRPAIGVSDDSGEFQILLSPRTYQVLGYRTVSVGTTPTLPNGGHAPAGTVLQSVAVAPRLVARPGDR